MNCNKVVTVMVLLCGSWAAEVSAQPGDAPAAEMVVTAARVERDVFATPQAVTLITDQEVEQANVTSTPDLFRYAEGVYMQKTNLGGGSPFMRGLTGKQVLILVDGVRLNNSYFRFGPHQYLNTVDPELIERIEVVRGPMSVLYGSDALGGTINIITRRPDPTLADGALDGLVHASYDTAVDGGSVRAQIGGRRGDAGFLAGITAKRLDDLKGGGSVGAQRPSGYDEWDADLQSDWRIDRRHSVRVALQHTDQDAVPKTSEVTLGSKLKYDYQPQERTLAYLEYSGKDLQLFDEVTARVSFSRQKEGEQIIARATPSQESAEVTDVATWGASLQLANRLGSRQRFTYGFEYYRDDYNTRKHLLDLGSGAVTPVAPGSPDGARYETLGLYLQDELRLSRKLDLTGGVRWSRIETDGQVGDQRLSLAVDQLTGSLNGLYRLAPHLNLVGGVAQGFRAPNMEDFFGRVDFYSEIPNTQLKPEESFSQEIGLKYYTRATTADLYLYQSDYDGLIERVTVGTRPDGQPIKQRRNIRNARIRGVEAGASHRISRHWLMAGTLMWTRGEDRDTGAPLRRIPPLNGTLRLRYDYNARLWTELGTVLAARQDRLSNGDIDDPRIPDGGTPGYAVYHIKAGWHPTRHQQWLVTLENLADKRYKTHGSGLYAPGRSLVVSYRLDLE